MERERGKERERERETRRVYRNNPYKNLNRQRKENEGVLGVQTLDVYSEVSNHQIIPLKTQFLQASINLILKIKGKFQSSDKDVLCPIGVSFVFYI